MPFGMVQLSPDTRLDGWDGCSGYHYSDSVVYGFSHTHLSGTGVSDYGDVLIMPGSKLTEEVITQAEQKEVAVILLLGDTLVSLEHMPDIPAIGIVRDQTNVRTAQQLLLSILINQRAALMERGVRIHAHLSQLAAEGEGLRGIARAMAEISGRGVLVVGR